MANHAASSNSEDKGFHELFFRRYDYDSLKAWIRKTEEEIDGIKDVPPLEIIEFEDLIKEAWSTARLVPWTYGKVRYRDYMDYLEKFFKNNFALRYDLRAAAKRCLETEKKYMGSCNAHEHKLSLEIIDAANRIKNGGKGEGDSAVATASLVCIAAEAKLMSNLLETDTKIFRLSNNIRLCALHMMAYSGPESAAIAGAMLGISQEAKKVCRYLHPENDRTVAKLQVCFSVRKCTLSFLGHLEKDLLSGNTVSSDVNILEKPTTDEAVAENENNKRKEMAGHLEQDLISGNTVSSDVNILDKPTTDEAVVENENNKRKEMAVTTEKKKKKKRLSTSCTHGK